MHKAIDFRKTKNTDNKKNIIFLDIDGVLQPYNNQYRFNYNMDKTIDFLVNKYDDNVYRLIDIYDVCAAYYDWDEIAIGILKKILYHTNSYIVIHSGWKEYLDLIQFKAIFRFYGLEDYIIDVCEKGDKKKVINKYLKQNKEKINKYLIIDDEDMTSEFGTHFLKTHNCLNLLNCDYIMRYMLSDFEIIENFDNIILTRNKNETLKIDFQIKTVESEELIYLDFQDLVSYPNKNDYLFAKNYFIHKFKDYLGLVISDNNQEKQFKLISLDTGTKIQLKEHMYMYYIPIQNYNFKSQKFYLEHKGEIAKNLS